MTKPTIRFTRLHPDARLPRYATAEAAGADVCCVEDIVLEPGRVVPVRTGLGCDIERGWEIQVRPRSGLALKQSIDVANAPGTIDSDYQGELIVLMVNRGTEQVSLEAGSRVAQIVVAPVHQAEFSFAEGDVSRVTERGAGGFGSTGVA